MALTLYNTLARRKETFVPPTTGPVTIYACGPTPYDYAHIGNLRTYVFNDILRRVLEYNDHKVRQVMNITDVDDKTIKASRELRVPLKSFTKQYEDLFWADLEKLNVKRPTITPHATDYIPQMIALIEVLLTKRAAFQAPDGVYFRVGGLEKYGRLGILPPAGTTPAEQNFALWKLEKPEDNGNAWNAPFGRGRPGWHIECSAMAKATIGPTVDIHTGGADLIFPHHENEIAQSETVHGKPLARYWLHGGFVNVGSGKMSKSLDNFVTLKTLEEKDVSPLAYRFWLLTAHYRATVNFTWQAVQSAQIAFGKLKNALAEMSDDDDDDKVNREQKKRFLELINDDLNMPRALAFALSETKNRATWLDFDRVFGLDLSRLDLNAEIPEEIKRLVVAREESRKNKDWQKSDRLRKEIELAGYRVRDTETRTKISKK